MGIKDTEEIVWTGINDQDQCDVSDGDNIVSIVCCSRR